MFRLTSFRHPTALQRAFSVSNVNYSGHNKWSKIKQRKGINDTAKGIVFGKANRDIALAVRTGGSGDPTKNLALAAVLQWCKAQDVPRENIERALAKATQGKGKDGESLTYEALAYGSIGIIIECLSSNSTRTVHNMRDILNLYGARFTPVGFMFERRGLVKVSVKEEALVDTIIERGIEGGAEDFDQDVREGVIEIQFKCPPTGLTKLTTAVIDTDSRCELLASEVIYAPIEAAPEPSEELGSNLSNLIETLEANEDVLRVWTSLDS